MGNAALSCCDDLALSRYCFEPRSTGDVRPRWMAGASFFYRKGPIPYEAYEVRAFGLFLTDMVKLIPRRRRALKFCIPVHNPRTSTIGGQHFAVFEPMS